MEKKYSQSAAIVAAKRLAGQEAVMLEYDANGKKKLAQKFKFKDTFRDNIDRIWIDIKEEGDVIGLWIMYQYDAIIELARTGILETELPRGGVRRTFLLNYKPLKRRDYGRKMSDV